jgi:hypothetical protein
MLLILEIWLTIAAWRKGWGALALLPIGAMLLIGFCIGLAVGASGGGTAELMAPALVVELLGILTLIVMASVAPKQAEDVGFATGEAVAEDVPGMVEGAADGGKLAPTMSVTDGTPASEVRGARATRA